MDIIEIAIMVMAILFIAPIAFFIGRWMDIFWQVKQKRQRLKMEYAIGRFVDKDTRSERLKCINLEHDMFTIGIHTFISNANRIYRQDKEEVGIFVSKKTLKWEEGVPIITLDADTLEPLDYDYGDKMREGVKPSEVGATIASHDAIQEQKHLINKPNIVMWFVIIIFLAGIAAALAYSAMDNSSTCVSLLKGMANSTASSSIVKTINGTQVIKGPGVP